MSQICKQLSKEQSFELLLKDIEHPHHHARPGYVQKVDVTYEPEVPDREYKYHIYEWQSKNQHEKNISTAHELTKKEQDAQVIAKLPHKKWTANSFDEVLYKHINFQYP
uniref:Uncharacterized protein n=1 Tax=Acrobeloides nanus TaxID=290746 RepID=A0A914CGG5_9BILA